MKPDRSNINPPNEAAAKANPPEAFPERTGQYIQGADAIRNLGPKEIASFLNHFVDLCEVPRISHFEQEVIDNRIRPYAERHGYTFVQDQAGNCGIFVPGRGKGAASKTGIVLQAHLDMVGAVSFEAPKDYFLKNPIKPVLLDRDIEGLGVVKVITAQGTTLGADDGYGVAAALAMGEPDALEDADPLLLLFTVREEIADQGVSELDTDLFLSNDNVHYQHLINLDSGDGPAIRVGGVGTLNIDFHWEPARHEPTLSQQPIKLLISGCKGGHSGRLIGEPHVNPLKALIATLNHHSIYGQFQLGALERPENPDGLATKAEATIWIDEANIDSVLDSVKEIFAAANYERIELEIGLAISKCDKHDPNLGEYRHPIVAEIGHEILLTLDQIPHGPYGPKGRPSHFSPHKDMAETVASSMNLRNIVTRADRNGSIAVTLFPRSFLDQDLASIRQEIEELLQETTVVSSGVGDDPTRKCQLSNQKAAWYPETEGLLFQYVVSELQKAYNSKVSVVAPTSSVEAGICAARLGIKTAVAFGPIIGDWHKPGEYMVVDTILPFLQALRGTIGSICNAQIN